MSGERDNPFERYGIDPLAGPEGITERLRELIESSPESERAAIRAAWEELTLHPLRRLRAALTAHPESRAPIGAPPPAAVAAPPDPPAMQAADLELGPGIAAALSPPPPLPELPLDHDRILHDGPDVH